MSEITGETLTAFRLELIENEKSKATVQKYASELGALAVYLQDRPITKAALLEYRELLRQKYRPQTVNGKLSAINAYLDFIARPQCRVRLLRLQRRAFVDENRELSQAEYRRLLMAAKARRSDRLYTLMLTICSTGIRVGELKYITVEAVGEGRAEISLKGKCRIVLLPKALRKQLREYIRRTGVGSGAVFRTRSGLPLDRSNIAHEMKRLCVAASVDPGKVFPHNLRHLFARTFYAIEKNLAHLADVLGHSSIETTRIYVAASAARHEHMLEKMRLIL